MRSLIEIPLIWVGLAVSSGTAGSADWPQWRGPDRDGRSPETHLLKQWPAEGPTLVWKARGLGGGYTTPSVAGGKVYGSGYVRDDEVLWCLDAAAGHAIWATRIGPAFRDMGYPDGPRSTPTVARNRVVTLTAGGVVVCLDRLGNIRWRRRLIEELEGKMMSGWGYSESPLIDGDRVVCSPGGNRGTVAAFRLSNGEVLWQSKQLTDPASYASLMPAEIDGVKQYIVLTGRSLAGLRPESGEVLWRVPRKGRTAVIPTPISKDHDVFVTSGYQIGSQLFHVEKRGKRFIVQQVYTSHEIENHHGGAVLVGDHVYATSGPMLVCMELGTGRVAWKARSVGKGSLSFADGHLYLRGERGPVALIEANPDRYVEKGRFEQPDRSNKRSWPHPVIAGGRLFLRDQDRLLCYEISQSSR